MSDNVFAYLDPEPVPASLAHPEAVWGQAREDYLGGDSAGAVCRRYGLSRSRFFERAKREGWRRQDRDGPGAEDRAAETALADAEIVEAALREPATPAYGLSRRAWAMAERAILTGRRLEAAGWLRMARDLRRMAMDEAGALSWSTTVKRCEPAAPSAAEPAPPLPSEPARPSEAAEPPSPRLELEAEPPEPSPVGPDWSAPAPDSPRPLVSAADLSIPDAALMSPKRLAAWLEDAFGPEEAALVAPRASPPRAARPEPERPDQSAPSPDSRERVPTSP